MHKRITLAWCVIVALVAYPLGSLATGCIRFLATGYLAFLASERLGSFATAHLGAMPEAAVPIAPGLAISFALALLAGLFVLPRRLSPLAAERPGAAVVSTIAWVLAGASIWTTYQFFIGNPKPEDAWALRFTSAAQATLAFSGLLLIQLLSGRLAPIVATIGCLPLFLIAFPAMTSAGTGGVGYVAVALFLLVNLAAYQALLARYRFDGYSLALYSLAVLQWIGVALVGWVLTLYVAGIADRVPTWLPIATALLQAFLTFGLPIGVLAARGRMSLARLFYNQASVEEAATATEVIRGAAAGRRTAWVLSYTGVSNEPRVRRQADALINSGWHVVVCGFDGHSPRPDQWTYIRLPDSDRFSPRTSQLLRFLHGAGIIVAVYARPKAVAAAGALVSHWCTRNWLHIKVCMLQIARREADLQPDLVIANDYYTCDVAYAICRISGAKFVVDSHEYAVEQSSHDPRWVKWTQPVVRAVEAHYLARADLVTTVCEGIADLLNADHRLRRPALVIRSVPLARPQPFRPTGERIEVLYHGGIWHERQLHTAIESMRLWRPEFDLIMRGDGDPAYVAELRRVVARYGLERRVFFEAAVPFDQIIPEANKADIGYFSYNNFSPQSEYVLPNKFFEYVMAGLALCVVDFAEMGKLTRRYGFGKLIPEHSPQAIAQTINSFTREEIDRLKKASIAATKDLNWDHEKERLLTAYNDLFGFGVTARLAPEVSSTPAIEALT
jgi:glycogen synthase